MRDNESNYQKIMKIKKENRKWYLLNVLIAILILSAPTYIQAQIIDLNTKLELHLPFNGNANDASGNNVPTTVIGPTLTSDRFGNPNSAYFFDGVDDYIKINNNNPIITEESFTICSWALMNGESKAERAQNAIFEQRDDESVNLYAKSSIVFLAEGNDLIRFSLRGSIPHIEGAEELTYAPENYFEWHHYAATLDSDKTMKIYLDGTLVATENYTREGDFITSVDHVDIGTHQYRGAIKGAFNGILDEIFIYNRVLTDCEISAIYSGIITDER